MRHLTMLTSSQTPGDGHEWRSASLQTSPYAAARGRAPGWSGA